MLLTISACIILFYTIYYRRRIYLNKQFLSSMTGKSISMAVGMISSLAIGLIIAIPLQGQLAVSTILSVLISLLVAWFISQPFGSLPVIEAMAASLMGSMMGAMLGEMLPSNHTTLVIISMDVIYLFSVSSILTLIRKEAAKADPPVLNRSQPYFFVLKIVIPFLLIAIATFLDQNHTDTKQDINTHTHHHMGNE